MITKMFTILLTTVFSSKYLRPAFKQGRLLFKTKHLFPTFQSWSQCLDKLVYAYGECEHS